MKRIRRRKRVCTLNWLYEAGGGPFSKHARGPHFLSIGFGAIARTEAGFDKGVLPYITTTDRFI